MPFSIVPSHAVPVTSRLVNTGARGIRDTSNVQTANPPFPILLSDQVTVQSGGENSFRSEAFTNNTGRPIELRGMRAMVQLAAPATGRIRGGGIIALELSAAGVPITRGSVPVWSMCRSDNRLNEFFNPNFIGNATTIYSWYFSQPLPLLPGQGLTVRGKHLGVIAQAATITLAFAGRVSPRPIPTRIPFVAAWTSNAFDYAVTGTDSAPPDELVNDTGRELIVDRIIGRSIAYDDTGLGAGNEELADFDDASLQGVTSFLVRLGISQSRPILKTFTPWRTVFGQNAALETDFILRPGDYLNADVQHVAGAARGGVAFVSSQNRAGLSIVGWREN
jgi:hypothetical protein